MSVIAGLWSFDGAIAVADACAQMLQPLRIYGPDDCAQYSGRSLAMGRCLLRLLPEDCYDRQPLAAEGVTAMVADVRINNRPQLADDLKLSAQCAASMADSSLLLAAWRHWGEHCVDHVDGAYCFAVWNEREQSLFLARDHTGERPLFYASTNHCFAFASMPKGLHALPFVGAEIDEEYIAHYLTLANMPVERAIFRNMRRLAPGCALRVNPHQIETWRHWRLPEPGGLRLRSEREYLESFRETFDRAVSARLRTTGAVGAQLSGGLDSSAVAATAASILAGRGDALTCFTAVPQSGFTAPPSSTHFSNEGPAAAEVAALYPNIRHVLVEPDQTAFLDILDHNNSLYDHPCFGPNNEVWSNAVMSRAQQMGITLLLNGSCGNCTFSYDGMPALSAWFRSGRWATLARFAMELRRARSASRRSILRQAVWPSLPFWLRAATDPHMRGFSLDYSPLHPAIAKRLDLKRRALRDLNSSSPDGRDMLGHMLRYGDVSETAIAAQGGWRLDFRDPTFDRHVVEFCVAVPLEQFLLHGRQRSLARRAMVGRLPQSTLTRTTRGRQSADWRLSLSRLRPRMLDEVRLFEQSPLASRMLDLARMRSLVENWPASGFDRPDIGRSYHIALTRGISVGRFLRKYDPDAAEAHDTRNP